MQTLEEKVAYLEGMLQRLHPDVDLGPEYLSLGSPTGLSSADDDALSSSKTENSSSMDHLSSEVALLCLSAAGQEPRYFGPSSAVSFSHIASQAMGLKRATNSPLLRRPVLNNLSKAQSNGQPVLTLPPLDEAGRLTSAYFENIHPQYPFLHQPTFKLWEQECRKTRKGTDSVRIGHVTAFFTNIVYAIGYLALHKAQVDSAEKYYNAAMEHLEYVLEVDGLEAIQALLSIAVYSIRSPLGASVWKVSGMAMRQCIQLGYQ
jgi:hypothetical protein